MMQALAQPRKGRSQATINLGQQDNLESTQVAIARAWKGAAAAVRGWCGEGPRTRAISSDVGATASVPAPWRPWCLTVRSLPSYNMRDWLVRTVQFHLAAQHESPSRMARRGTRRGPPQVTCIGGCRRTAACGVRSVRHG